MFMYLSIRNVIVFRLHFAVLQLQWKAQKLTSWNVVTLKDNVVDQLLRVTNYVKLTFLMIRIALFNSATTFHQRQAEGVYRPH